MIGIDGGGSRTRARLADARGETLGRGEASASNPRTNGLRAAQQEILSAIERAFNDAQIQKRRVEAACLGVGGLESLGPRDDLQVWMHESIARRVTLINDGQIVVAAGTPDNWGIALIAGTGSIAWGRTPAGQTARAGGWGYLFGDEGSAFALAREALRAAACAADGRGQPTRLLGIILDHWKLREPLQLIPQVYDSALTNADLARLAPLVIAAAAQGDPAARDLVERAAEELSSAVVALARRLNFGSVEIPLALTGGLLLEAESLRQFLLAALEQSQFRFAPIELVQEPVIGAVRLAVELLMKS